MNSILNSSLKYSLVLIILGHYSSPPDCIWVPGLRKQLLVTTWGPSWANLDALCRYELGTAESSKKAFRLLVAMAKIIVREQCVLIVISKSWKVLSSFL